MSTTVEPWKDCPTCSGGGKVNTLPVWSKEHPGTIECREGGDPCPTCTSHNAAVEREVAAAVGAANSSHALEGHAMMEDRDNALIERDAALAEVARLTAQGKELRDALGLALSDRGMTPENGNHNRQRNCRTCGAASILGEPAGHADWCWVGESEKALSTPAGSDEPLRRVRAEAWDEAIKALDHFGYMPVNPYRTVVPERGGEGGSR